MRIVSLLPSATEMVFALGLEDRLVGVTHECDHPEAVRHLPRVTHTLIPTETSSGQIDGLVRERLAEGRALYTLDLPVLEELEPDLILTQALCDVCAVDEREVREAACHLPGHPDVLNLEPQTLGEVLTALRKVGSATGIEARADRVVRALRDRVDRVTARSERVEAPRRVVFLEWLDPPFSGGHWTPEIIRLAGGEDLLGREGGASRTLTWEEIATSRAGLVFIAACGYSVERTLEDLPPLVRIPAWRALPAVRSGEVHVTNGSHYFSRPGPRLVDSLEILAHTLHPKLHPLPDSLPRPRRASLPRRAVEAAAGR